MNGSRSYFVVTALVFAIVGIAHLARAIAGWPVAVAGVDVPVAISWPVGIGALALAAWGLKSAR